MQQWAQAILLEKLASAAHVEKTLDIEATSCYTDEEVRKAAVEGAVAAIDGHWLKSYKRLLGNVADLLCSTVSRLLRSPNRRIRYARC